MTNIGVLSSALATNQADWKEKAERAKKTLEEQEKHDSLLNGNNYSYYDIEDKYVPSYNFNKTGAEYYTENWSSQDFWSINHNDSNSLEEFTINLKKTIVDDYRKQNPDSDFMYESDGTMGGTPSLKLTNYLKSIDYKKEYEEYKQCRGCSTDEELRALNTTCFKTKEDLILDAAGNMMVTSKSLYDNGFASQSLISAGVYIPGVVAQMGIQDVANYINSSQYAGNFKNQVSAFQSFADLISKQDNIDENTRNIFAGISKNITNSKGAIAAFSDEIERINAQRASINSQYNASLIAKYDS